MSRERRPLSRGRLLGFSLASVLLLLGAAELALRLAGVPPTPDRTNTWFADHVLSPPLWHEATTEAGQRFVSPGQAHHFHPFALDKPPGAFRVAVFGGSAAHGYGVLEPGAFPHRLEQLLQLAMPETDVQVINLGTVAWSTQQLLWAARQVWEVSDWDLVIIYAGNNELLELSSWKSFMEPAEHRRYTRALLTTQRIGHLRLYSMLHGVFAKEPLHALRNTDNEPPPGTGDDLPQKEDPPELGGDEEQQGLQIGVDPIQSVQALNTASKKAVPKAERAHMGDLELRYAARTYTHNVRQIVAEARAHGSPVLVMNPAPNDFHDPAYFPYPGEAGARFDALMKVADEAIRDGRTDAGQAALDEALALQPEDPRALFAQAQILSMANRKEDARVWFDRARSRAEYPNRVVPAVSEAIRAFEGEPGVAGVIDIEQVFRDQSEGGLISYDLVYDHCHPSVEGNFVIAGAVGAWLLANPVPGMGPIEPIDVASWVADGKHRMESASAANPRVWEWTGLDFEGKRGGGRYIADFQGDWRVLRDELLERAAQPEATALDHLWAGNARFLAYEVDEALEAWEVALEADPQLCIAHANRAYALRMLGLRSQALGDATAAAACDPDDPEFGAMKRLLTALNSSP